MSEIHELASYRLLDNPLRDWLFAFAAFAVTFTVLPLIKRYLSRIARSVRGTNQPVAIELLLRLLAKTSRLFVLVAALNLGERFLTLDPQVHRVLGILIVVGVWYQIGRWAMVAIDFFIERQQVRRGEQDAGFASSLTVLKFIARALIWSLAFLLVLDNLGVNITTLVAGLGVGGIAVALAVQTILGDLLASLSITLDKPFAVGDSLAIGDCQGKVEHIGIKSTRLRSVTGEQIILANADILKSRMRNFGRMNERRGMLNIGVTYETPRAKLERVVNLIETAIRAQPQIRLERCHFKEFGPSSLNFEAVFFVLSADYNLMMNAQQAISFRILESFEREGIEFAYPTQKVFLQELGVRGE
jgi:small-conductance mechanosensitive channel